MGYTTDFDGFIEIIPPLSKIEVEFLDNFAQTRHMDRDQGPYYVDDSWGHNTNGVHDQNCPPDGQPSLWCQWIPNDTSDGIVWNGMEKFHESPEWMAYLIKHFLGINPLAKKELPFLQGHVLNGTIAAQGEDPDDMWLLHVHDNQVSVEDIEKVPSGKIRSVS